MNSLYPIVRGLLLSILLRGALCDECGPCACSDNVGGHVVIANCATRGLTSVPEDFPSKTLSIDFSGNRLAPENLNGLCAYDLVNVNLTGNHLTSLSSHQFVRCYITGRIDFGKNIFESITESSFAGLRDLKVVLNLESQYFHPLSLTTLTDLRELSIVLHQNTLSSDLFKKSHLVHTLTIDVPNAFEIPEDLFRPMAETLNTLKLVADSLSLIGEEILKGCSKLDVFELHARNLHSIPSVLFNSAPSLTRIRMRGVVSLPRHVFENIGQLEVLEIHGVEDMPSDEFAGLSVLEVLDLSESFVSKIKFEWFKDLNSLERLVLANVGLKTLTSDDFIGLSSLKSLDLSGNQLRKIEKFTFKHVSDTINHIGLGKNSLKTVSDDTFVGLAQLQTLDLSSNEIHSITTNALASLKELKELLLHDNKIYLLPNGIFDRNNKLESLDLSSNVISELLPSVFESLTSLRILNISDNLLVTLTNLENSDYPNIMNIDMSFNRFKCRCENLEFTNILDDLYILGTCWYNTTIDKADFKTYMGSSECRPEPPASPQTSVFVTTLAPDTDTSSLQIRMYTDQWASKKQLINSTRLSSLLSSQIENNFNGTSSCPACTTTYIDTEQTRENPTDGQQKPNATLQTNLPIEIHANTTEINPLSPDSQLSHLQSSTKIQETAVNPTTMFAESVNKKVSIVGSNVATLTLKLSSINPKATVLSTTKASSSQQQKQITGRLLNMLSVSSGSIPTSTSAKSTSRLARGTHTTPILTTRSLFNKKTTLDTTSDTNTAIGIKLTTLIVSTSPTTSATATPSNMGMSPITSTSGTLSPSSNQITDDKSDTPNNKVSAIYTTVPKPEANIKHSGSSNKSVSLTATGLSSTQTTPGSLISSSTTRTPQDMSSMNAKSMSTYFNSTSLSKTASNLIESVSPSTLEMITRAEKVATSNITPSNSSSVTSDTASKSATYLSIDPTATFTSDHKSDIDASLSSAAKLVTGTRLSTNIEQSRGLTSGTRVPSIKPISSTNGFPQLNSASTSMGFIKTTTSSKTITSTLRTEPSLVLSQNGVPKSSNNPPFTGSQQHTQITPTSRNQGTIGNTSLLDTHISFSRTHASTDAPSVLKSTGYNKTNAVNSLRKIDEYDPSETKPFNLAPPCLKSSTTPTTRNTTDRIGNKTDVDTDDSREFPETVLNLEEGDASKYGIFIAIACISVALLACMLVMVYLSIRKSHRRRAYAVSRIEAQRLKIKRLNVTHEIGSTERNNGSLQKLPPVPVDTVDSENDTELVNSVDVASV